MSVCLTTVECNSSGKISIKRNLILSTHINLFSMIITCGCLHLGIVVLSNNISQVHMVY